MVLVFYSSSGAEQHRRMLSIFELMNEVKAAPASHHEALAVLAVQCSAGPQSMLFMQPLQRCAGAMQPEIYDSLKGVLMAHFSLGLLWRVSIDLTDGLPVFQKETHDDTTWVISTSVLYHWRKTRKRRKKANLISCPIQYFCESSGLRHVHFDKWISTGRLRYVEQVEFEKWTSVNGLRQVGFDKSCDSKVLT